MFLRGRVGYLVVFFVGVGLLSLPVQATPVPRSPAAAPAAASQLLITIPKGAKLTAALEAISRAARLPVLCQVPQFERTLEKEVTAQPLDEALNEVSRSYHFHWLRTPSSIVFVRRLWDERETLDLEIEEFREIGREAVNLLRPFVPCSPFDLSASVARRDFYYGLAPEQIQQMQTKEGMRFLALTREQQSAFRQLSTQNTYQDVFMQALRVAEAYGSSWPRSHLVYLNEQSQGEIIRLLSYEFSSSVEVDGKSGTLVNEQFREETGNVPALPTGEVLPGTVHRRSSSLEKNVRIPNGLIKLSKLAEAIERTTNERIQTPQWARDRSFLLVSDQASARALLDGLALMYGWDLRRERPGEWMLGRQMVTPAQSFAELHAAVQELLPPMVRLCRTTGLRTPAPNAALGRALRIRERHEYYAIMAEIRKEVGAGWTAVKMEDLTPPLQRRIANHLALSFFGSLVNEAALAKPRNWLLKMETGFLMLQGGVGRGENPVLEFAVRERIPPNGTRSSGWGWVVNSSSLGD